MVDLSTRFRSNFVGCCIALISTGLSLLVAEALIRLVVTPKTRLIMPVGETPLHSDGQPLYELDSELGFRPILGSSLYNEFGTLHNEYPLGKSPGVERLLFIGDSTTARRRIVLALEQVYGSEKYEYWNAGVGGFDVIQEVEFYRRYNSEIRPDHVILTFHNNDLEITPVVLTDVEGRSTTYSPARGLTGHSPRLLQLSHMYRLWVGLRHRWAGGRREVLRQTRQSLQQISQELDRAGIRFTVLVLPILKPPAQWTPAEMQKRKEALEMLRALKIRHIDLLPSLSKALRAGVDCQESPGDIWHPSDDLAGYFAVDLKEEGLL